MSPTTSAATNDDRVTSQWAGLITEDWRWVDWRNDNREIRTMSCTPAVECSSVHKSPRFTLAANQLSELSAYSVSLNISLCHSQWHPWVVPISIPLCLCFYLVPFLRYSVTNNVVTFKFGLGVIQGNWKWHHSTITFLLALHTMVLSWLAFHTMALSCIMFEIKQYIGRKLQFFIPMN